MLEHVSYRQSAYTLPDHAWFGFLTMISAVLIILLVPEPADA